MKTSVIILLSKIASKINRIVEDLRWLAGQLYPPKKAYVPVRREQYYPRKKY